VFFKKIVKIISICDYTQGIESFEVHTPSRNKKDSCFFKEFGIGTCNIGFDDCLVLGWLFFNKAKQ
jgi:hypothetical protein